MSKGPHHKWEVTDKCALMLHIFRTGPILLQDKERPFHIYSSLNTHFLKQLGSLSYMLMINNSTFALKIVELTTTPAARTLSEKME